MNRFLWVLIGLTSAATVSCARSVNVEEQRTALMTADREWSQAAKDPDKFVSYFANDATIYPPGMPMVTGGDAIRKTYTEMTKAPGFALSWTPTRADVSASGDLGTTVGAYQMTLGGITEKGKYVTVWQKQEDGAWKVKEDIFNADEMPKPPAGAHVTVPANTLKWGDAPPGLPAGAKVAIVSGDPTQAQPYVMRAQLPANYRIQPHWHPTMENITVLTGSVAIGMGDTFDEKAMEEVPAGGFTSVPSEMHHFFMAKSPSIIQVHGIGPFGITYVDAGNDPRVKKSN